MVKPVISIGHNCLEKFLTKFLAPVFQSTDIVYSSSVG